MIVLSQCLRTALANVTFAGKLVFGASLFFGRATAAGFAKRRLFDDFLFALFDLRRVAVNKALALLPPGRVACSAPPLQ